MSTIEAINTQFNHLQEVENKLFDVVKLQLHPNVEGFTSPDSFAIYKGTGGEALGTVGRVYEPTQPKVLYDGLINTLLEAGTDMDRLEFVQNKGGAIVRFKVPIGKLGFVNMRGEQDETELFANLQTGYDGHTKTSMFISTFRMKCKNGAKASMTEFEVSYKNTKGNVGRIGTFANEFARLLQGVETLDEMYKKMNRIEITAEKMDDYLKAVTGMSQKEYSDYNTRRRNIFDRINESIALELSRTGNTAFGLYNGITHYTNHVAVETNVDDYLFTGGGTKMNDKAFDFALSMN